MKKQVEQQKEEPRPKGFRYAWYIELWFVFVRCIVTMLGVATAPVAGPLAVTGMLKSGSYKIAQGALPVATTDEEVEAVEALTTILRRHEKIAISSAITFWVGACFAWLAIVVGFFTSRNPTIEVTKVAGAATAVVAGSVWYGLSFKRRELNDELWHRHLHRTSRR